MMRAFKERLKEMAADPKEPFSEIVRRRVGKTRAPALSVSLRNLTVLLPDLLGSLHAWSGDARVPETVRRASGDLLTYMYHAKDFIHDDQGLFGYSDDAYMAGSVYAAFLESGGGRGASPSLKEVRAMLSAAREVLPRECAQMDLVLEDLLSGRRERFDKMLEKV